MAFCDFCNCSDCQYGSDRMLYALTNDGRSICDVCYTYDVCTRDKSNTNGPCENKSCMHRPVLIGKFRSIKEILE